MPLTFAGTFITDFFNCASDTPPGSEIKRVAFPLTQDVESLNLGATESGTARVVFSGGGRTLNAILAPTAADVVAMQTTMNAWLWNQDAGTLTYTDAAGGTRTYANMKLTQLQWHGQIQVHGASVGPAAYTGPAMYRQDFSATFEMLKEGA